MSPKGPSTLVRALSRSHPTLDAPEELIRSGRVTVDGVVMTNPASVVGPAAHISLLTPNVLRGEAKLRAALEGFRFDVRGKIALDAGAAAGGFTKTLLEAGCTRVYAVDVGHGQLLGSLRQDPRVRNLEGTNIGSLSTAVVPDSLSVVTLDLSYISLTDAVPQLNRLSFANGAMLIALVKPMFELHRSRPPDSEDELRRALETAIAGIERAGWTTRHTMPSPVTGARGAVEFLVGAERSSDGGTTP